MAETKTAGLSAALLAFQAEGVKLQKDSLNPHFKNKYIGLDSLFASVLPVLNDCGLVLLQMPTTHEGLPALTTRVVHAASGESVESTMQLALAKTDPQSQGSALTYARRYALMAFLGLVADEDTDGRTTPRRSGAAKAEGTPKAAPAEEAPNGSAVPPTPFATEAQRKRLFALAKEHRVEGPRLRSILASVTGQESTAQIPRDKYDAVCVAVQAEDVPFE